MSTGGSASWSIIPLDIAGLLGPKGVGAEKSRGRDVSLPLLSLPEFQLAVGIRAACRTGSRSRAISNTVASWVSPSSEENKPAMGLGMLVKKAE